ncbi:MAG: DUF1819 family protein [Spirulina sp. DLM2.Bin59]|nr:MAG: DUF1819 family protein [Spirulina sp. DLM2.Bin59]
MPRYSLAFIAAPLLLPESVRVAKLYGELQDWSAVRSHVLTTNFFQARRAKTGQRIYQEIASRLKTRSDEELSLLVTGTPADQQYLLWAAVCRRYALVGDFALEMVAEPFSRLHRTLTRGDFHIFLNRKNPWHQELATMRPSTETKVRQVLFKMLREVGILGEGDRLHAAILSPALLEVLPRRDLRFFPLPNP